MSCYYPTYKATNGEYGPATRNRKYKPQPYHSFKAKPRPNKTRWKINASGEYEVFRQACDGNWIDENEALLSQHEGCECELGKNGERLAFFPKTKNVSDPWHGYPIPSTLIKDNIVFDLWFKQERISEATYKRLLRRKL